MDAYAPDREKRREHLLDDCSQPRATQCLFFLFLYRTHLHIGYDHWVAIIDERYIDPRYGKLPLAILGDINIFYISVQQVFGKVK